MRYTAPAATAARAASGFDARYALGGLAFDP
jgi:hypothetical protein